MGNRLELALDIAQELQAVETLHYLNKNWLTHGANPKLDSEMKQERLRDLIRHLSGIDSEAQAVELSSHGIHFPATTIEMKRGEEYAGLILGKDGEVSYHLILLPGAADSINWKDAIKWAEAQGGELPTRREQALLYANLKEQFDGAWYWSSEQRAGDSVYAWCQYFDGGDQGWGGKGDERRARAVRRLIIE